MKDVPLRSMVAARLDAFDPYAFADLRDGLFGLPVAMRRFSHAVELRNTVCPAKSRLYPGVLFSLWPGR